MDWRSIIEDTVTLFAIVNPISGIPFFLEITKNHDSKTRYHAATTTALTGAAILLVFSFLGQVILEKVLKITLNDLKIAGGIVLLCISVISIIKNPGKNEHHGVSTTELSAVPLAFPLLVGPGSIVTSFLIFQRQPWYIAALIIAINSLLLWATLRLSGPIYKIIGDLGSKVFAKVMYILLAAIAVRFILTGIIAYFGKA